MTHKVAVEAFEKAGDPEAYVGEGEPWTPLKLYYDRAFNPERTLALHEHLLDTHGESLLSGWIENIAHRASSGEAPRHETTTRILVTLSLIHISEPTRRLRGSRMPSSA